MFRIGVCPSQVEWIALHKSDVKQEEPKDIFVFVGTSVRLFVKNREWARSTPVHVSA